MLRRFFTSLLFLASTASVCLAADSHAPRHETHYNWRRLAEGITEDCQSDYDKAYAIYHWVCSRIVYDTDREIRDADRCYDERKGVCQAYAELYYRLAKAVGMDVYCVSGKSKNTQTGAVSDKGHAWVCVITEDGTPILMDPTWGAGGVTKENVFVRREDDRKWFDVDPRVMICTHWPKDEDFQFLDNPLSEEEFYAADFQSPDMSNACVVWVPVLVEEEPEEYIEERIDEGSETPDDELDLTWHFLIAGGLLCGLVYRYRETA